MKVLAVDTGRNVGMVAIEYTDSGILHKCIQEQLPSDCGARYARLYEILSTEAPDVIVYEKVAKHFGTLAAHQFGAYEGIMQMYAHNSGCRIYPVYVTRAKALTGMTRAQKDEIADYVRRVYSDIIPPDADNNVCDAMLILLAGVAEHLGEPYVEQLLEYRHGH